ncbi:HDOD domain-containing protein [Photobacterium swingsii]|uniref:HDOD domain-containing protein n=1 Tax=Photobacterium swingsii TaxID=680026 RepID=A0A0J8VF46_9GAMM|nr:HDOD domain-containing protein [Photobacterium swingsii]KMV32068.1 histidine kinase [Photobacterium swingsii]PSW26842.1 HDOD domain-containing protein [Photobacterium swingsii]
MDHVSFFWLKPENNKIVKGLESEFCALVKDAIRHDRLILPPIPEVLARLLDLCKQEETTVRDVADLLLDDPSITALIIKTSNTVIFNRRNVICHDIFTAVSRLGIHRVRDIVAVYAIQELKNNANFSLECNTILKHSAQNSRQLAATMAVIANRLPDKNQHKNRLEIDKCLLAGLLADIGLFGLVHEYQAYLDSGNYLDLDIAKYIFENCCDQSSETVLKHWGFDDDFLAVATNTKPHNYPEHHNSYYLEIARMASHLLMFRNNDTDIETHEIELDLNGAELMYELTNISDSEFTGLTKEAMQNSGL